MKCEYVRICKEAAVAYLNIIPLHSPEETEKDS
jgi:hypothetical protein